MVGLLAAVMATTGMLGAEVATAAVPTFPDNLVVFPNRDFVVVEGYASHQGETATVTVTRPSLGNQVIGSAQGIVSGGDVAFEINHPGGVCWGAGTDLKITPDILPDDVAAISFGGQAAGETRVQDGYVTGPATLTGLTLTVTGHFGPNVNKDNAEQRIVEPALASTSVARRDVRATPGPLTPAPKGGYSSSLAFGVDGPDTFTATYVFDDPAVAQIAARVRAVFMGVLLGAKGSRDGP